MLTPNLRDYGYGWSIVTRGDSRTIMHSGGNDIGFHSVIGWRENPKYRESVIVLSNSGEIPGIGAYADFIARHLYGILSSDEQTNYSAIALTAPKIDSSLVGVYRLADGSRFELKQSHGEWLLFPFGQSAVNIISLRSGSNDAVNVEANESTQRLLDAFVGGDCSSSKVKDLWPDPDTAEKSCARLAAALEQLKKSNGNEPLHFEIVGSVLDWWNQSTTTATFVRASGAMGERIFRIHWLDRK